MRRAAFQILAKGLADMGLGGVGVALAGTGQRMPGLKVFGNGLVEQRALGVARVVELGFGARLPARMRMRLRWACSGGQRHPRSVQGHQRLGTAQLAR